MIHLFTKKGKKTMKQFGETSPNFSEAVKNLVRKAALDCPIVYHAMKAIDNHEMSLEDAMGRAIHILVQQKKALSNNLIKYIDRYGVLPDLTTSESPTSPCQE